MNIPTPEQIRLKKFDILIAGLGSIVKQAQEQIGAMAIQLSEFANDPTKVHHASHTLQWQEGNVHALAKAAHIGSLYNDLVQTRAAGNLDKADSPEVLIAAVKKGLTRELIQNRYRQASSGIYHNALEAAMRAAAADLADDFSPLDQILWECEKVDAEVKKAEEVSDNSGC